MRNIKEWCGNDGAPMNRIVEDKGTESAIDYYHSQTKEDVKHMQDILPIINYILKEDSVVTCGRSIVNASTGKITLVEVKVDGVNVPWAMMSRKMMSHIFGECASAKIEEVMLHILKRIGIDAISSTVVDIDYWTCVRTEPNKFCITFK